MLHVLKFTCLLKKSMLGSQFNVVVQFKVNWSSTGIHSENRKAQNQHK